MVEQEKINNEEPEIVFTEGEKTVITEEEKIIPFATPTKIEEPVEKEKVTVEEEKEETPTTVPTDITETDDYKKTAAIYKKEIQKLDEDYDLLKYAKEYIAAFNKFNDALGKCSNLALAGVIEYVNRLDAAKRTNLASENVRNMIIETLDSKDPELEDDVIERYPKM